MRLRFSGIWVLTWLAWGGAQAGTPDSVFTPRNDPSEDRYVFAVRTPAVSASAEGPAFRIAIPGFDAIERHPGAPDLPLKIVRVAIPPGATPTVEVREVVEDVLRGVRPRAVLRERFDVPPIESDSVRDQERPRRDVTRHPTREEDAAAFSRVWPEGIVEIVETGWLRDQRYVALRIAPVRWDPRSRGLRVARSFEVEVRFDGETGARSAPSLDPSLESVYRGAFLNYAQGTTFRGGGDDLAPAGSSETSSALSSSHPIRRIRVREHRVHRIDFARVSGTPFATEPLSQWKLTNRGVEVPLHVRDVNANDLLDSGDWVQFWGQALDDEPKTALNTDIPGTDQDIFEYRDFTDENVYFLTVEAGARSRMATRAVAPTMTRTPPNDFEAISHQEVDSADGWRPLGGADPWYWTPTMTSGGATSNRTISVPLPGLASGTAAARVLARIRGLTENVNLFPDHKSRVSLQNSSSQTLATNDDDGTFDGRMIYTHDFTWSGTGGTLTNPAQVFIEARPIASGNHQMILDWVEIRYRRLFQASGDVLVFDWPDGDAEFTVSGLTSASPTVYEISGRVGGGAVVDAVRLTGGTVTGAGPFTIRFRSDNDPGIADGTPRRYVVFGDGAVLVPAAVDFAADTVSDLRTNTAQTDLIVIAEPTVLGASSQATLNQLLSWRQTNQGIASRTVFLQDIYDEFNDGLPGPVAIRRFLQWVMTPGDGWASPKPAWVLLLGDGSFDYKAGLANGNIVPTQILFKDDPSFGYYASDNILTMVVGSDDNPDLSIGRLSARSDAELNTILTKILNYHQSPPAGNWRRHGVVISDRGKNYNVNEAADFETINDQALAFMKRPPHTSRRLRYWTDFCGGSAAGCTPTATDSMRLEIKKAINGTDGVSDGASCVQYIGHGNFEVWSDDAFHDDRVSLPPLDSDDLVNGGRLPMLFVHNCLTSGFMSTLSRTLGENWQKKADGGSISVYAPSGLSQNYFGDRASDIIWERFFGKYKERLLGIPVLENWLDLCGSGTTQACQSYVLLGDPTTRAVFPTVSPVTNVVAAGGNAQVSLNWTASATPGATYDVYRTTNLFVGYTKANGSPIAGTSFVDTGRTNATTYYYYVVAVDASGFESRWSNFNSDCDVSGPDCVKATPLNPNPPNPPTGVVVTDPETGGRLNISWSANSENDLQYYEVRYGTSPGNWPNVRNVGKSTTDVLTGLTNGQTYYIVVTATNTSGLTSSPSTEKTGIPTFVRGTRSPGFITTLRVNKSGTDAALSWNAVTTDIYGKPETVAHYEIYRGTTPDFLPGPGNKIGQVAGTSFTDPGALGTGLPNYHWLVRAMDVDGNAGGLGYQLPNGIDAMTMAKSGTTPGNVILSWPAVTTDFDGRPTRIDKYEIYASGTPFSREAIRNGTVPLLQSTTSTSIEITPAASSRYYSVIAVDTRGNKSSF